MITNGARKAALEHDIDVELLASRHKGTHLSREDVMRAFRSHLRTTRRETVIGSGTVATWPSTNTLAGFSPGCEIRTPKACFRNANGRRFASTGGEVDRLTNAAPASRMLVSTSSEHHVAPVSPPPAASPVTASGAADHGPADRGQSLQARVDNALGPAPTVDLDALIADLAVAGEVEALVRVWAAECVTDGTWRLVEALHARGKRGLPPGTIQLPPDRTRRLGPERRLHKICKGRLTHARSDAAHVHLRQALAWLEAQSANGRQTFLSGAKGQARRALAVELQQEMGVDRETARGLVTKLKQMRKV